MIRKIININEEKCDGCGLCADACHEGAISIVNGKAKLLRDDYCDGLGDCLPVCPTGAITFETREAAPYDEELVKKNQSAKQNAKQNAEESLAEDFASELKHWPIQIKLAPVSAPFFNGADLLVAADCTAFAYGGFHRDFMKGKATIIGCPKLDEGNYSDKLSAIISSNDIKSITVARMSVPCCGGIEHAVKVALEKSGKEIALKTVTISTDGRL